MDVGIFIRDFLDDPSRPLCQQIDEAAEVCRRAKSLGFSAIYEPQQFIAHPAVCLQPIQTLARVAPEAAGLKLITGILLLPYFSPVDVAAQTATLHHIGNRRFILGVGIGYREKELAAFGSNRRDRVGRFEESIAIMKALWAGKEVTFQGKHWQVNQAEMAFTPAQKPRPPIWMAAQSASAVRHHGRCLPHRAAA